MKRLFLLLILSALPASAQTVISGAAIFSGGPAAQSMKCAGSLIADGTIASGASIYTLGAVSPAASAAMVGRYLVPNGTVAVGNSFPVAWTPTVTAVIDATHLQLSSAAPFSLTATASAIYPTAYLWQDDQATIQAQLATNTDVSLPVGNCWVSKPLIWSGQSIHGQGRTSSSITGAPGSDVFWRPDKSVIDPATGLGYNYPLISNGHQYDFAINLDGSVETTLQPGWVARKRWAGQQSAWANNPTGPCWAGVALGASMGAGDTTLLLATAPTLNQPYFKCGFAQMGSVKIGTEVINYRGVTGATLHIDVRGDQGTTAATHANGAAVVPVNPFDYTNVTDYLPAWQIGNAAFAIEQQDANVQSGGSIYEDAFERIAVSLVNNKQYHEAGSSAFIYSAAPPYEAGFAGNVVRNVPFGLVFPFPAHNTDVSIIGQSTMDNASFNNNSIQGSIPLIAASGAGVDIQKDMWYEYPSKPPTFTGPIIEAHGLVQTKMLSNNGGAGAVGTNFGGWTISALYQEAKVGQGATNTAGPFAEIGSSNTWTASSIGGAAAAVWPQFGTVLIDGDSNTGSGTTAANLVVTGKNNAPHGPITQVSEIGNTASFQPQYSRREENFPMLRPKFGNITPDALAMGISDPNKMFTSLQDLFLTPDDLSDTQTDRSVSIGDGYFVDMTAPITHAYTKMPVQTIGTVWQTRLRGQPVPMPMISMLPASTGMFYMAVKLDQPGTATMGLQFVCGNGSKAIQTYALTTAWQVLALAYDASPANCGASAGNYGFVNYVATTALPVIDFAWEAYVPAGVPPGVPTVVSAFTNDVPYLTSTSTVAAANVSGLGTVATSNDFNDLINKPAVAAAAIIPVNGIALPVTAIAGNACSGVLTATATGTLTSSGISATFTADVSGIVGWGSSGGLLLRTWPTTNTINYRVCNPTAISITPGVAAVNFRVQP